MTKKILAIDDESDVLLVIEVSLKSAGYQVMTAGNGAEGLAIAKREKPDVILLDIMMPGMDGFEVLEKLHEDENTVNIPIIMLTALSDKTKIMEALNKGIDFYITKPFDHHDLISKVHTVIQESVQAHHDEMM